MTTKTNPKHFNLSVLFAIITNVYLYFIPGQDKWSWTYNGAWSIAELIIGLPLMVFFLTFVYGIIISFFAGVID